jgi:hypothetical protein
VVVSYEGNRPDHNGNKLCREFVKQEIGFGFYGVLGVFYACCLEISIEPGELTAVH